jgi:hypothetical protein
VLAVVGLVVPAACGSGSKPTVRLGQADQGRTITLGLGRQAVVRLDQPQWAFQPVAGGAVRALGAPKLVFVNTGCKRVSGCGYVTLTVKAVARGRSTIVALRGLCGELFRCPPSKREFSLTILAPSPPPPEPATTGARPRERSSSGR